MLTILLIGALWAHALARLLSHDTMLQPALAVILAGVVTVGVLEVPHV